MTLLDVHGYPTEEWIDFIGKYTPDESLPLLKFLELLSEGWAMTGFVLHRKYKGKRKLELHTGGWSGNEEIISAILANVELTQMRYVMWKTGGHHYFEILI